MIDTDKKSALKLIEYRIERAAKWFKDKNVQDIEAFEKDPNIREYFTIYGFEISRYFTYSGENNFQDIFSQLKSKKGLYIKDEAEMNHEDFDELKKYISNGGYVYFETFPFLSVASEDNQSRIDYYLKQIKAGKIAVVCIQNNNNEMVGKSYSEIRDLQFTLSTDKNPEVFTAKINETLEMKNSFNELE